MLVDLHNIAVQIQFSYHFKVQTSRCQLRLKNLTTLYTERDTLRNINYPEFRIAPNFEGSAIYVRMCLYIYVINNGGKIQTDIFYKPTDSKQYLLYTSCHPKHTRNSIPYNLARRLKTIVSDEGTLNNRLSDLKMYLLKRKYPLKLIEDAISTVRSLDRRTLLNNNDKIKEANAIPYVTTFNPYNPEFFS